MLSFLRRRGWAFAVAGVLVAVAGWMALAPVSAVYFTSLLDPTPHQLHTVYSWSTAEQDVLFSDATGADLAHYDGDTTKTRLTNGMRVACGNAFVAGPHEQEDAPDSPRVCSDIRGHHRVVALILLGLAVLAALTPLIARFLPERSDNHYRQPYAQRRALRRDH